MANVKLKSIKFPDLSNTYVVPSTAGDLTYSADGVYSDGTVGKAIQATTASLEDYAKVDGSYESMTVGNAEQIVSNVRENDRTPYVFRTSGGSVDIGDREYVNGIVGGTVAWNQYAKKLNSQNWLAESGVTATFGDGIVEFTSGTLNNGVKNATTAGGQTVTGHRYLVMMDAKISDGTDGPAISLIGSGQAAFSCAFRLTETMSSYGKIVTANRDNSIILYVFAAESRTLNKTITLKNLTVFDLTQMFGSTIADYIYSLEQANAGAGVAWFKKLFPKPYYAYNSGTLMHVSGLVSHDMTGFNQWDEEWELGSYSASTGNKTSSSTSIRSTNKIRILPNTSYMAQFNSGSMNGIYFYDADETYLGSDLAQGKVTAGTFTTPANAHYMTFQMNATYGATYNHDICINISWDGSRNGEYEPYELHSYPLDTDLTLRGVPKLDANNNLYYDGDVYEPDGTVTRKYGIVDLGSLTWQYNASNQAFYTWTLHETQTNAIKASANRLLPSNLICVPYVTMGSYYVYSAEGTNRTIALLNGGAVIVKDTAYTDATAFETAMSGVYLVYELATPTTETADPYQTPQIVDDFGTEEYVLENSIVPVGHDTDYPVNLVAKLEMAPNSPSGNGDYIVRQTNGTNEYVPLVIEDALPQIPSTAGSYKLTVTVAEGSDPVLSWEAE